MLCEWPPPDPVLPVFAVWLACLPGVIAPPGGFCPVGKGCEWEASCDADKEAFAVEPPTFPVEVTVFAPPVEAKALLLDFPTATLSCKSGTAKVDASKKNFKEEKL